MKKAFYLAFLLLLMVSGTASAQCVPDTLTYPNSGFYPLPTAPLPNGTVGVPYSQLLTINVPADTTLNLSNLIGFPTPPVTVTITSLTIGVVNGLPIGIFGSVNPPSGSIPGGTSGCLDIAGTATTAGQYAFNIPTTLTFVVPGNIPVIGGTTQNLPGQVPYNLEIVAATAVNPAVGNIGVSQSLPNPTSGVTVIRYNVSSVSDVQLEIVDLKGRVVLRKSQTGVSGDQAFRFDAAEFAPGMYLYRLSDGNHSVVKKMVVE